jgi:predicted aspartyl protease
MQRHSHRMNHRNALTLGILLLLCACRQATSPAPEYRPEEAGTVDHAMCLLGFTAVPIREAVTGHHLVEATINGRSGRFVLDTGANATVLDQAHRQRFGVSGNLPGFGGAIGIGGGGSANQVAIEGMRIGAVEIRRDRIVTADLGQLLRVLGRVTGGTVYGIIGQDVLKEHRAIIDVARPMLYLMAEDRGPSPVPAERCRAEEGQAAA